jgi:hypothetical protein
MPFRQQVREEWHHRRPVRPELRNELSETVFETEPEDRPVRICDVVLVESEQRAVALDARQRADGFAVKQDVEDEYVSRLCICWVVNPNFITEFIRAVELSWESDYMDKCGNHALANSK